MYTDGDNNASLLQVVPHTADRSNRRQEKKIMMMLVFKINSFICPEEILI